MKKKWTEDVVRAEAAKYPSQFAFRKANPGAYKAAKHYLKIIDSLFELKRRHWTEGEILKEAAKYKSSGAFRAANYGAY